MNRLAFAIASAIKRHDEDAPASVEVMTYALSILLNTGLILGGSLLLGGLSGRAGETLLALAALGALRFVSGGVHLRTAAACNAVSIAICAGVPWLAPLMSDWLPAAGAFSLAVMAVWAPRPDRHAQLPPQWLPACKAVAVSLVALNFALGSNVIGLAFLVQSLTVVPWGRR